MESKKEMNDGFILDLWERIFYYLGKISIFSLLKKLVWNKVNNKFRFIEWWVLGNLIFAILMSMVIYYTSSKVIARIALFYGILRVFEIVVYQINVILFDPYRTEKRGEKYRIKSIPRILVLLVHNYIEIVFWYVVMTIVILKLNNVEKIFSLSYYIKASFLCMATFNNELIIANGNFLSNIAFAETFSGIILTIISIARFIGILPDIEEIKLDISDETP